MTKRSRSAEDCVDEAMLIELYKRLDAFLTEWKREQALKQLEAVEREPKNE